MDQIRFITDISQQGKHSQFFINNQPETLTLIGRAQNLSPFTDYLLSNGDAISQILPYLDIYEFAALCRTSKALSTHCDRNIFSLLDRRLLTTPQIRQVYGPTVREVHNKLFAERSTGISLFVARQLNESCAKTYHWEGYNFTEWTVHTEYTGSMGTTTNGIYVYDKKTNRILPLNKMTVFRVYGVRPHTQKIMASLPESGNTRLEDQFHTINLLDYKQLCGLRFKALSQCGNLATIIPMFQHFYRVETETNTIEPLNSTRYTCFIYKYNALPSYLIGDELLVKQILRRHSLLPLYV
jgi:hypothetical protein